MAPPAGVRSAGAVSSSRHRVRTARGHEVAVLRERPPGARGRGGEGDRERVHVLCHGFNSSHMSSTLRAAARALHARGESTVSLDFSGNGASGGEWVFAGYAREADDLRAVAEWASAECDMEVKSVIGHSKAGTVVTLFAGMDDLELPGGVPDLVILCGRFNMKEGLRERLGDAYDDAVTNGSGIVTPNVGTPYTVTRADILEREGLDSAAACARVRSRRALVVHGTADEVIPYADAELYERALPPSAGARRVLIEGADHRFSKHREELGDAVAAFVCG